MATTATMQQQGSLVFQQSESTHVGAEGPMMKMLHENAPRVVGLLKLPMDIMMAFTGSPWLICYACFASVGRLIMITYGDKHHQQKLAAEAKAREESGAGEASPLSKVADPRNYPVEASAGASVIGETLGIGYGFELLEDGKPAAWTIMGLGALAVWLYSNMLFGKEKKKEAPQDSTGPGLHFAQSHSQTVGFIGGIQQYMKDNPVVVSSIAAIAISVIGMVGGLTGGASIWYVSALAFGLVANVVQMALVRKNDYNVEGVKEKTSFQERITSQRQHGDEAPQPGVS